MSSTFGNHIKLSLFGQSHGPAIGMTLDGVPAGLPVDMEKLQEFLNRRAPGNHAWTSSRKEADTPHFLSGIVESFTCGAPIAAIIENTNPISRDYSSLNDTPRPGHADYTAHMKYGGYEDASGGGHFSGRLTAPLCIAGGLCLQWLEDMGIHIHAHIKQIANIVDNSWDPVNPQLEMGDIDFPVLNPVSAIKMKACIETLRTKGDSTGGAIECAVTGLPVGIGEPMFDGLENRIAAAVFAIPAIKGIDFGNVDDQSFLLGSTNNDPFIYKDNQIVTATNNAGGILGGISTGMPLIFQVRIKPTPSISLPQNTVSLSKKEPAILTVKGRHDPCIVPRAVPVIEAAAAIAIFDLLLGNTQINRRKQHGSNGIPQAN